MWLRINLRGECVWLNNVQLSFLYITLLTLAYPWAGLQDELTCTQRRRVHCVAILTLLALGGLLAETPHIGGGSVQAHRSSHPQVALAI